MTLRHKQHSQQTEGNTLGKLGSATNVVLPSTLAYRERAQLAKKHGFEYYQIYACTSSRGMSVYDRLTADASVRQVLRSMHTPVQPPRDSLDSLMVASAAAGSSGSSGSGCGSSKMAANRPSSGFVSNNGMPSLMRKLHESATISSGRGGSTSSGDIPLGSLHPVTLKSYYKHYPLDFMAAARPAAQTTNQALRMLGTYSGDATVAAALGMHIPGGVCPGFHPDVKGC